MQYTEIIDTVTPTWLRQRMTKHGLGVVDFYKPLGLHQSTISEILNDTPGRPNRLARVVLFFYFQTKNQRAGLMKITKIFTDEKAAQDFSDLIWKILNAELTETDDPELSRYIDFFNENDPCEMVIKKVPDGVEIGLAIAPDRPMDDFDQWGSSN